MKKLKDNARCLIKLLVCSGILLTGAVGIGVASYYWAQYWVSLS